MGKNAQMSVAMTINDEGTAALDATPTWKATVEAALALVAGTGAGQFDLAYAAERAVADGANDDIDLSGSLTDAFGDTITAAEIVALMVVNRPKDLSDTVNTTDLTIGAGTNPWIGVLGATHTIGPIKPGGVVFIGASDAAGIGAVTGGTGDILRIANSAGAICNYQIAILARSA